MSSSIRVHVHEQMIFLTHLALENFFDVATFKLAIDEESLRFHNTSLLLFKIYEILFICFTILNRISVQGFCR